VNPQRVYAVTVNTYSDGAEHVHSYTWPITAEIAVSLALQLKGLLGEPIESLTTTDGLSGNVTAL
jgi:hypothetical protein